MTWSSLLVPQATLLAALFGLAGVVIGWAANAYIQVRMERTRTFNARADVLAKEISSAVQQFTMNAASGLHSMCWLTWLAEKRPGQLTQDRIDKYNDELHSALPKIAGYLSTIAALDPKLHESLDEQVEEIYKLDELIGRTALSFKSDPASAARDIGARFGEVRRLERGLARSVGNVLASRIRTPL